MKSSLREGEMKMEKAKPNNLVYGGVAQLGEHLPCKQGVMGSNPIISTSYFQSNKEMFIENRIRNKRNETDSCILRKTCYKDISKH